MRHTIVRLTAAAVAAIALLGVAACGVSGTDGNNTGAAPNATATYKGTPTSVTKRATPSASPAATPVATGGAIVPDQVTVTLDKAAYAVTDPITIYVNNGLAATIDTADHQTACTIVTMQQSFGAGWRAVGKCRLMTPTRLVPIAAHATSVVQLGGGPGQLASAPWPAGTYRIQFTYNGPPSSTPSPVYSAEFRIG